MASNYSKELAVMLQKYIADERSTDNNKLRQMLQETSVAGRYKLLREVNTTRFIFIRNGIWRAAQANDINTLKCMMNGFTSEQAATLGINSALPIGAHRGSTEVVEYLLALLNQDQRVEVLMKGDFYGDTALHEALINNHPDTANVILASVEPSNQMKLLKIKNKQGQSAEDLPGFNFLKPSQANAKQQKTSAKETAQLQTELAKQKEDNVEKQRVSAEVIAQLQTELAKQKEELAKLKEDNVEQQRVSADVNAQLQTDNARQERAFTQRFNQQEEEIARQERAFTQRFNQQEEEIQRLVENFNRFEAYLRTPEVSDARGDQEIEDNH